MSETNVNLPLQGALLQDTQRLAQELNLSWPRLIVLALQDFVRRYQGRKQLVERLQTAYSDKALDDNELMIVQKMRPIHRRIVEGEW